MKNAKERCEHEKQQYNSNSASLDLFFLRLVLLLRQEKHLWLAKVKPQANKMAIILSKNLGVKDCICDSNGSNGDQRCIVSSHYESCNYKLKPAQGIQLWNLLFLCL